MDDPDVEVGGYSDIYRETPRKSFNHRTKRATTKGTVFIFLLAMKITTNDLSRINSSSQPVTNESAKACQTAQQQQQASKRL